MAVLNRRGTGNALLAIFTLLFSLLAMEMAARWWLSDISTTGDHGTWLSRRWYAENPASKNQYNFRERDFSARPAAGVYRIAVVGDSFTYAPGIPEAARISNRLEASLNARDGAGDGVRYEVVNFGRSGANMEEHVQNMAIALDAARPDFVLLQLYLNDFDDPVDRRPRPQPLGAVLHRQLSATSVLYFLAARVFAETQMKLGGIDVDAYYRRFLDPDDPLAQRADVRLGRIFDEPRRRSVPLGVFIWPELTRPLDTSPNDRLIERVLGRCEAERIVCVDLRAALRAEPVHAKLIVNRFDTHASALANGLASDLLVSRFGDIWQRAAATRALPRQAPPPGTSAP